MGGVAGQGGAVGGSLGGFFLRFFFPPETLKWSRLTIYDLAFCCSTGPWRDAQSQMRTKKKPKRAKGRKGKSLDHHPVMCVCVCGCTGVQDLSGLYFILHNWACNESNWVFMFSVPDKSPVPFVSFPVTPFFSCVCMCVIAPGHCHAPLWAMWAAKCLAHFIHQPAGSANQLTPPAICVNILSNFRPENEFQIYIFFVFFSFISF